MKPTLSSLCAAAAVMGLPCLASAAPVMPPAPSAAAAVMMLQSVCLPLVEGGNLRSIAKANHLRQEDGQWTLVIDHQRRLELDPPDPANPHVCGATIHHSVGAGPAIRQAVDDWARSRSPALAAVKVGQTSTGPSYLRTTSTWQGPTPNGLVGVALSEEKTLSGEPVAGKLDQSEIEVSLTPKAT
jgi:hypothetical protein